jgi:hypothetical protein
MRDQSRNAGLEGAESGHAGEGMLVFRVYGEEAAEPQLGPALEPGTEYESNPIAASSLLRSNPDKCWVPGNLNRVLCTCQTFYVERLGRAWMKRTLARERGGVGRLPNCASLVRTTGSSVAQIPE